MKILIDNGHGSNTPGKCSPDKSLQEYAYTREIAGRIVEELRARGFDAERLVTETTDVPLAERARRVNEWCGKLGANNVILVSVHCNAAGNGSWLGAGGWCAYTSPGQTKADTLATYLYKAAEKGLAKYIELFPLRKDEGAYTPQQKPIRADYSDGDPDFEARFYILVKTRCPAVLTESLFQDNKADVAFLLSDEGKEALVKTHVDGITSYIASV
nr:MAG TPA: Cell wall hydrolase autolysin [Caudoviricetes sp.]